ncbi:MAG: DUF2459 domain-containing protein [Spirochaetes bacterium]|nr:DUF2459 domain-containing protein [Spirochaetota bacterium]
MSKKSFLLKYAVLLSLFIFSAVSSTADVNTDDIQAGTFYVVNNGLHTGIVIRITDETIRKISVLSEFRQFAYADFGWGDADYYQAGTGGIYLTLKALFVPSSSTVRVHGTDMSVDSITKYCIYSIRFTASSAQFDRICSFINGSFKHDNSGMFIKLSSNGSGNTVFYKSVYSYHLFNTCNTWIASALKKGDFRISKKIIITADDLYEAVSPLGEIIKQN